MRIVYIPTFSIFTNHLLNYPTPINISYYWSFGSLAGLYLAIQILTGVLAVMFFNPSSTSAFLAIEHIARDINAGWLIRYIHANGASFFFIFIYSHLARGFYFNSYFAPRKHLWFSGLFLFLLAM